MRIIAGSARGRQLRGPKGPGVRPTSDKVRESLFSILAPILPGARFLDLFTGTGAMGLEALSRGASFALLVDSSRASLATARENTALTGLGDAAHLLNLRIGAHAVPRLLPFAPFDIAFADPPYAEVSPDEVLEWLGTSLLTEDGLFIVEHDRRHPSPEAANGLERTDQRRFGDTLVSFYRRSAGGSGQ
jgi:RNA methyltransferase, RsmD family